jgi:hypothetical protein
MPSTGVASDTSPIEGHERQHLAADVTHGDNQRLPPQVHAPSTTEAQHGQIDHQADEIRDKGGPPSADSQLGRTFYQHGSRRVKYRRDQDDDIRKRHDATSRGGHVAVPRCA